MAFPRQPTKRKKAPTDAADEPGSGSLPGFPAGHPGASGVFLPIPQDLEHRFCMLSGGAGVRQRIDQRPAWLPDDRESARPEGLSRARALRERRLGPTVFFSPSELTRRGSAASPTADDHIRRGFTSSPDAIPSVSPREASVCFPVPAVRKSGRPGGVLTEEDDGSSTGRSDEI